MLRRKARKPNQTNAKNSSHQEAVEQLKDAVGRLIARRILREWAQHHQMSGTNQSSNADAKPAKGISSFRPAPAVCHLSHGFITYLQLFTKPKRSAMNDLLFPHIQLERPLAFLDLETTSLSVSNARIVEIAILQLRPNERPQSFSTRVNPCIPIPPSATEVHGIRDKEPRDLSAAVKLYLGRSHARAHSAAADVYATAQILNAQLIRYPEFPSRPSELHSVLVEVDVGRRFRRRSDGEVIFAFGKYAGMLLKEVASQDTGYLNGLLGADLLDDAKAIIRQALLGKSSEPVNPD